jgi:hypothetical protein
MLLSKIWLILKFILITFVILTSPWFIPQPLTNKIFLLLTTLSLFFFFNFKTSTQKIIFLICFFVLVYIQVSSTDIANTYNFTDHQKYIYQNRLNQYPPSLARLGNILENRLDSPIIYRLRQNFFDSLDLVNYFKNLFLPTLFIPFVIGFNKFLKRPNKFIATTAVISILLLTITGPNGSYGPLLMFPFITIIISRYSLEK